MKCKYCGNELQEKEQKCPFCGTPAGEELPGAGQASSGQGGQGTPDAVSAAGQTSVAPEKKKSPGKLIGIAAAIAADRKSVV